MFTVFGCLILCCSVCLCEGGGWEMSSFQSSALLLIHRSKCGWPYPYNFLDWIFLVLRISPTGAVCISRVTCLNIKVRTRVCSWHTMRPIIRAPWFVHLELSDHQINLDVPEVSSTSLVLEQLLVALHFQRFWAPGELNLVNGNSKWDAKSYLLHMAGVESIHLELVRRRQGMVSK